MKFFSRARRPGDPDDVNRRFNEIVADQGFPSLDPFSFDEAMESVHPINSAEAEAMNPAPIRPRTPTLLAWCCFLLGVGLALAAAFGVSLPTWLRWGSLILGVAGLAWLITLIPRHRRDDHLDWRV